MTIETIIVVVFFLFALIVLSIALSILILLKLSKMGENLNEITAQLDAANEKVTKIAADVAHLHTLIDGTGETPTAEEWAAVKEKATALNASLQAVDDSTPEA